MPISDKRLTDDEWEAYKSWSTKISDTLNDTSMEDMIARMPKLDNTSMDPSILNNATVSVSHDPVVIDSMPHEIKEIVTCGRLPLRKDGGIDVYKIDRVLRSASTVSVRVAIIKRLLGKQNG